MDKGFSEFEEQWARSSGSRIADIQGKVARICGDPSTADGDSLSAAIAAASSSAALAAVREYHEWLSR